MFSYRFTEDEKRLAKRATKRVTKRVTTRMGKVLITAFRRHPCSPDMQHIDSIYICLEIYILPFRVSQLKPIYSEVQLHSNPTKLLATVQLPPLSQGSSKHGSPVRNSNCD